MTTFATLLVCLATVSEPGQAELLVFTSARCPACRTAEPVVERLQSEGAAIRLVDADFDRDLLRRFGVDKVPTFVMVCQGQEVDRAIGPVGYARLRTMLAKVPSGGSEAAGLGNSPLAQRPTTAPPASEACENGVCPLPGAGLARPEPPRAVSAPDPRTASPAEIEAYALAASVRIRVDDRTGTGFGTGVIIDVREDGGGQRDALIMTCGHLFRDFTPDSDVIEVDFPHHKDNRSVRATLIDFTADRADVGLIAIRLAQPLPVVRVAGSAVRPTVGQDVFSVGCDRGSPPTVRKTRIVGIDKYLGPPNIEIAGQPVQGRSGGGLFNAAGELIGICNAADPQDDEGLYAALPLLHWQLAKIGQDRIYRAEAGRANDQRLASGPSAPADALSRSVPAPQATAPLPPTPRHAPLPQLTPVSLTASAGSPAASLRSAEGWSGQGVAASDAEVMVIVRPRNGEPPRTIVIEQPSATLWDEITRSQAGSTRNDAPRTAALPRTAYRQPMSSASEPAQEGTSPRSSQAWPAYDGRPL